MRAGTSEIFMDKGLQRTAPEMPVDKGLQSMGFSVGWGGRTVTHVFARCYLCVRSMQGKGQERGQGE